MSWKSKLEKPVEPNDGIVILYRKMLDAPVVSTGFGTDSQLNALRIIPTKFFNPDTFFSFGGEYMLVSEFKEYIKAKDNAPQQDVSVYLEEIKRLKSIISEISKLTEGGK